MPGSFLAACTLRTADLAVLLEPCSSTMLPPLQRQISAEFRELVEAIFRELSDAIANHLPLTDSARLAQASRALNVAARARLAVLRPKLEPLLSAPFKLQLSKLPVMRTLDLINRNLGASGARVLCARYARGARLREGVRASARVRACVCV